MTIASSWGTSTLQALLARRLFLNLWIAWDVVRSHWWTLHASYMPNKKYFHNWFSRDGQDDGFWLHRPAGVSSPSWLPLGWLRACCFLAILLDDSLALTGRDFQCPHSTGYTTWSSDRYPLISLWYSQSHQESLLPVVVLMWWGAFER